MKKKSMVSKDVRLRESRLPTYVTVWGKIKTLSLTDAKNAQFEIREIVQRYTGKRNTLNINIYTKNGKYANDVKLFTLDEVVNKLKFFVDIDIEDVLCKGEN